MNLNQAKVKTNYIITKLSVNRFEQKRLIDFGITVGAKLLILKRFPFHGPIEIKIRSSYVAVREDLAKKIEVEVID